jgi:CIC family chloride channel protein
MHRRSSHLAAAIRERRRLAAPSVLLGILTGLLAVGFHVSLDLGEAWRRQAVEFAHDQGDYGPALVMAGAVAGVIASAWLVARFAPEASGSGIPHLKAVLLGYCGFRWFRVLLIKFASAVVGITAGLAVGRGGPTVHMGGALGQGVASLWRSSPEDRHILTAAGGGAGLAATFNTPLAGLVFLLEELGWKVASPGFFSAALACLSADMVCRALLGQFPMFRLTVAETPDLLQLPAFLVLGLAAGVLGGFFNRSLLGLQKAVGSLRRSKVFWWLAIGLLAGVLGWLAPEWLGGGQDIVNGVLAGDAALPLQVIAMGFAIRFLLTVASSCSGASCGLFIPVLVLGALLGLGVGTLAQQGLPSVTAEPRLFAVVGMAAYFTAVIRAPLTGVVLIIEMTGNYELILPLFVACFSALVVADALQELPIYEALLELGLNRTPSSRP